MTRSEREEAVEIESQAAVIQFINRSKQRDWSQYDLAADNLLLEEMRERGHLLVPDTIALTEGFMGVEAQRPFYVGEQEYAFKHILSERMLLGRWDPEEGRHPPTLELVLVCSGARTEAQIAEYNEKVLLHGWSPKNHPGVNGVPGARIYRMFQERATYANYRGLLHLIRRDYGLPENLTDMERERGKQIGAAEPIDRVSKDELGHHVINLQLVRILLKYFPDETREKIREVQEGFIMPDVLRFLPNRRPFIHALHNTRIYDGKVFQQQVVEPTLKSLGLAA